jgi:hypothetical protein
MSNIEQGISNTKVPTGPEPRRDPLAGEMAKSLQSLSSLEAREVDKKQAAGNRGIERPTYFFLLAA